MVMNPFRIAVYDKAFVRRGWVGDYREVVATVRHNATSSVDVTVPVTSPRLADLTADGARLVVDYNAAAAQGGRDWQFLFSGAIVEVRGENDAPNRSVTFTAHSDFRLLGMILGWPNPTGAITAQGAADAYWKATGAAETVVKQAVGVNATRLGLPLTVAPDLGRGSSVSVALRMHPLADRLFPAVDEAGIGVDIRQSGAGFLLDVYEAQDTGLTLSERSGVIQRWSYSKTAPGVTRVVIGGSGEGTSREFRQLIHAGRESGFGMVAEVFRDARDTDVPGEMDARGAETMAEGGPTAGFAFELCESRGFRYGKTFRVGDIVTLQVTPEVAVTDVVREATLRHSTEEGLVVQPRVGVESAQPEARLVRMVDRLTKRLRDKEAGY